MMYTCCIQQHIHVEGACHRLLAHDCAISTMVHRCKGLVYLLSTLHGVIIIVNNILGGCLMQRCTVRRLLHHAHHYSSALYAASCLMHITIDVE